MNPTLDTLLIRNDWSFTACDIETPDDAATGKVVVTGRGDGKAQLVLKMNGEKPFRLATLDDTTRVHCLRDIVPLYIEADCITNWRYQLEPHIESIA